MGNRGKAVGHGVNPQGYGNGKGAAADTEFAQEPKSQLEAAAKKSHTKR